MSLSYGSKDASSINKTDINNLGFIPALKNQK